MSLLVIATLNLCLGLKGKKDLVKDILISNKIDILAMQEIEIESGFDEKTLSIPGYILETENNDLKKRSGFYINTSVKYSHKSNFEGRNNHLVVIEVEDKKKPKRIINIYRSFNPPNLTAKDLFERQLDLISSAFDMNAMLLGDLNLDYSRKHDIRYSRASLFDLFTLKLGGA